MWGPFSSTYNFITTGAHGFFAPLAHVLFATAKVIIKVSTFHEAKLAILIKVLFWELLSTSLLCNSDSRSGYPHLCVPTEFSCKLVHSVTSFIRFYQELFEVPLLCAGSATASSL